MTVKTAEAIMVSQAVHRQPRDDCVTNPPITGPIAVFRLAAELGIFLSKWRLTWTKEYGASECRNGNSTFDRAHEVDIRPGENRERCATEHASQKSTNEERLQILSERDRDLKDDEQGHADEHWSRPSVILRERSEDHRTFDSCQHSQFNAVVRGALPTPNPKTYRPTPSVMTSSLTPNLTDVSPNVVEKTLEPKLTVNVMNPELTTINHFFDGEKFVGFCGS